MAVTDDPEIARKIKLMRYNGEDRESRHFYYHGHNFLMDNVHAALLSVKLKYLPQWLKRRKAIAEKYKSGLAGVKEVVTPHFDDPRFSDTYTNYVIRAERRDELKEYLTQQRVETMISWATPLYKEPVFSAEGGFASGGEDKKPRLVDARGDVPELQETEKICREVISLPMYPELTDEQVDYVAETIKNFYRT